VEDAITKTVHIGGIETYSNVYVSEETAEFHAQEAVGCHQEGGDHTKY
jgi:hypothetical protein